MAEPFIGDARFEAGCHLADVRAALTCAGTIVDRIAEEQAEAVPELVDALRFVLRTADLHAEDLTRYIPLLPTSEPPG